jgi:hypothetical protein
VIPAFDVDGNLPPGLHAATWEEFTDRFATTPHRERLAAGLQRALRVLQSAGCRTAYVDGSFVTSKPVPGDFDACWDVTGVVGADLARLDPVLLDFSDERAAQKAKYLGELFPAQAIEGSTRRRFLDFFQIDRESGNPKGIVAIDLQSLP